eukprot:m.469920 g.469920  ORF g.469920 m.469920 type:complete len:819 (-) comp29236_c0_seq1:82-2538(-)
MFDGSMLGSEFLMPSLSLDPNAASSDEDEMPATPQRRMHDNEVMAFNSESNFEELLNVMVVMVVGLMGAGKSLLIQVQQGALCEFDEQTEKFVVTERRGLPGAKFPRVSDRFVSTTITSQVYDAPSGYKYLDGAGLDEGRGGIYDQWSRFCKATAFNLVAGVESVLVVINFNQTFSGRCEGVAQLAEKLVSTFGDGETAQPFWDSMCFVFTHAISYRGPMSINTIKDKVQGVLNERKKGAEQLKNKYTHMKVRQSSMSAADKKDYRRLLSQIKLLEAIADGNSRCTVSNPIDARACQQQQATIEMMIEQSRTVRKPELEAHVGAQSSGDFGMCQRLTRLAVDNLPSQKSWVRLLTQIEEEAAKTTATYDDSGHDWRGQKSSLLTKYRSRISECTTKIQEQSAIVQDLKSRTGLKVFDKVQIRGERSSSWMPTTWRIFGQGYVSQELKHATEWYTEARIEGDHYSVTNEDKKGKTGKYFAKFTSNNGYNLSIDVLFSRPECELPATLKLIQAAEKTISNLKLERDRLESDETSLAGIDSFKQLNSFILRSQESTRSELRKLTDSLVTPFEVQLMGESKPFEYTPGLVIDKLAKTLTTLAHCGLLQRILTGTGHSAMASAQSFVVAHHEATTRRKAALDNAAIRTFLGRDMLVQLQPRTKNLDDVEPINPLFSFEGLTTKIRGSSEAFTDVTTVMEPVVQDNMAWIGLGIVVMYWWQIYSIFLVCGVIMLAKGVGGISEKCVMAMSREMSDVVRLVISSVFLLLYKVAHQVNAVSFERTTLEVLNRVIPEGPPPADTDYGIFGLAGYLLGKLRPSVLASK